MKKVHSNTQDNNQAFTIHTYHNKREVIPKPNGILARDMGHRTHRKDNTQYS